MLFILAFIFVITRICIYFLFGLPPTDLDVHFDAAIQNSISRKLFYCGFEYVYPPGIIPFIKFPLLFGQSFDLYRLGYRLEMFFFDFLTFIFTYLTIKLLPSKNRAIFTSLSYYLMGSIFLGYLIYERIDIVISFILVSSLYFYIKGERFYKYSYLLLTIGGVIKIIPLFYIPVLMISEFKISGKAKSLKNGLFSILLVVLFFVLYQFFVCDQFFHNILLQMGRGIQIESTWASIAFMNDWVRFFDPPEIVYYLRAHHFTLASTPPALLFFSKYFLWVALSFLYLYFLVKPIYLNPNFIVSAFYITTLVIISSQGVLSPQYLIWILPFIALAYNTVSSKLIFLILNFFILILSAIFSYYGYGKLIVERDLWWNFVLLLRNGLILYLTFFIIKSHREYGLRSSM